MRIENILIILNTICAVYGIYGGEELRRENSEFPWLVAFYMKGIDEFLCAGSLISETHVLSGKIYFTK